MPVFMILVYAGLTIGFAFNASRPEHNAQTEQVFLVLAAVFGALTFAQLVWARFDPKTLHR